LSERRACGLSGSTLSGCAALLIRWKFFGRCCIYHIDDVSRDEPFLINVRDKPFAVVPYTLDMNDIVDYETRYFSTAMYADDLGGIRRALC
jgi:hypothetical protein